MPVPLRPQKTFTVVRQIANHLDSSTYYVRAVIRNAYTDATLANLDLENKGSQRFKKDWRVPADSSGDGFYVSIVTSVYTDSGYTTKSEAYGDEENTYFVEARSTGGKGGGGVVGAGAGAGMDSRTVRRIFQEELEKVLDRIPEPKEVEIPEMPAMRWEEVLAEVRELRASVAQLPQQATDLQPILDGMQVLAQAVVDKEVTPETDISSLVITLHDLSDKMEEHYRALMASNEAMHTEKYEQFFANLQEMLTNMKFSIAPSKATLEAETPKSPRQIEDEQPISVDALTT